jgi:hypothetical protein
MSEAVNAEGTATIRTNAISAVTTIIDRIGRDCARQHMVKDIIAFYPFAFTRVIIEDILNLNFWIN